MGGGTVFFVLGMGLTEEAVHRRMVPLLQKTEGAPQNNSTRPSPRGRLESYKVSFRYLSLLIAVESHYFVTSSRVLFIEQSIRYKMLVPFLYD